MKVKTWIVTTEKNEKFEIFAPTRYLALLNFRFEIGYSPIKTIGLKRK
jgi:hypothetical protein